jgi:hypothetical protein
MIILLEYIKRTWLILCKFAKYTYRKILTISPSFLLVWYCISIWNTYFDNTLGQNLKICAQIINFMMCSLLARVIFNKFKNPRILDFSCCFILLSWFLYYTPQDSSNGGYNMIMHLFYISIDLYTILFLIDSFLGFLTETSFFKKSGKKIDNIYKCAIAFLCAFSFLIYAKCLRNY